MLEKTCAIRLSRAKKRKERLDLFKRIEHIVVDGEVILPSIELLFESRQTENIYRVVD